jgi:hypothetical protein
MLRLLADENFRGIIVRQLRRHSPSVDILRVQDVGLMGAADSVVLDWAALEGRVVLTHDINTMTLEAYQRIRAGLPMPGVIEVPLHLIIGRAVEDLLLLVECSLPGEFDNQVRYLPL